MAWKRELAAVACPLACAALASHQHRRSQCMRQMLGIALALPSTDALMI
jgi:hypothetical protein